ncbi:MAG: glycosyltransferase [Alphaproteobacteria bacterium]|nr:MAG: glycosyltransferase [Alphaproteobacteria bacterium]
MPDTKRILLVNNFYAPHVVGGAEIVVQNLAGWLAAEGHDVMVVATCGPGQNEAPDRSAGGVRVVRFFPTNLWWNYERFQSGDSRGAVRRLIWNLRDQWNFDTLQRFDAILRDFAPDVVHTHNLKGFSPAVWTAARQHGVPILHTAHDYHLICNRGVMLRGVAACATRCTSCWAGSLPRRMLAHAVDALVAPSHFVLDRHLEAGVAGRSGSHVIRNGIHGALGRKRRRAGPLRLLFLGQVRREKGAELLGEMLAKLPRGAAVLEVAGTGAALPMLEALAARDERITLSGFLSGAAKQAALERADVLLFPSLWAENAPLSLAEGMRAGLPAIASAIGAVPEFVAAGRTGLLVPPGDAQAMAQAVIRLAEEDGLLELLSEGARSASRALTVEVMGQAYASLYDEVLAAAAARYRAVPAA